MNEEPILKIKLHYNAQVNIKYIHINKIYALSSKTRLNKLKKNNMLKFDEIEKDTNLFICNIQF